MIAAFSTNLSRTTVWIDRGVTRTLGKGFGEFEAWRDALLEEEELPSSTSWSARSPTRSTGCATASPRGASATSSGSPGCTACASSHREHRRVEGNRQTRGERGRGVGQARHRGEGGGQGLWRADRSIDQGFSTRVLRGDRLGLVGANGAGKTTLVSLLTGTLAPDAGKRAARRQPRDGDPRPEARLARSGDDVAGRADGRRQRVGRGRRQPAST